MSPHVITVPTLIVAMKTLTFLLGGLISYFAYRAYARTGSPALRALAIGFGLVTLGSAVAGATDLFLELPLRANLLIETTLTAAGFGTIVYSLYRT